jgi:elongation factor Ts
MAVSIEQVKSLRDKTGVSIIQCKKALEASNGDEGAAIDFLRKKGAAKAAERSDRSTSEGCVATYVHSNAKIGVLIKLTCETDFVAKNEDFRSLGVDIAMHIAATNPACISPEEVSDELVEKEKGIWKEQLLAEGKPENILDNIMRGKEAKFRGERALLSQTFVKDSELTIEKLLVNNINKLGENIKIESFVRYSV